MTVVVEESVHSCFPSLLSPEPWSPLVWTVLSGAIEFVRKNAQLRATTRGSWAEFSGGDNDAPLPEWLKEPVDGQTEGAEEDGFEGPRLSDSYCYALVGKNCYQDLATRKSSVFTIFASQFMLVGFIIFSTLDPDANFMLKGTSPRPHQEVHSLNTRIFRVFL